jgi:hypothetical protein
MDWLRIAEKYTQSELFLLYTSGKDTIGGIPLFRKCQYRKQLTSLMSPPYPNQTLMSNLGPIFSDYDVLKKHRKEHLLRSFHKELVRYIGKNLPFDVVRIYMPVGLTDIREFQWAGYSVVPEYTYTMKIDDTKSIWAALKREARKSIVRAEQIGIEIKESDIDGYNFVLQKVYETFREQGISLNVSRSYMSELFKALYPKRLRVFVASYKDQKVSGQVITLHKDKISIWIGGLRTNLRGVYPVDLLIWKIINWANSNGFLYCENVGANNPSISTFKSRFGFELQPYYVISKASRRFRAIKSLSTLLNSGVASIREHIFRYHKIQIDEQESENSEF